MSWTIIDNLNQRLKNYWENNSSSPAVKIVICDVNGTYIYLPVYMEDRSFVYVVSNNIFAIIKTKCKLSSTDKKTLYYEVIPTVDDITLGRIPIRALDCPKIISQLQLKELAAYEM